MCVNGFVYMDSAMNDVARATLIDVPQPSSAPPGKVQREAFGRQLRALRRERGLTLTDCSQLTGLAISTLSKAERGLMALTYDRLTQLAVGLGVDMSALFGNLGESFRSGGLAVARRGAFQLQETPTYSYEMLFPELWYKAMTPMTGVVRARDRHEFPDFIRHAGQEFVHVISGRLTIHTERNESYTLEVGESLYFDSGVGHVYLSASEEDARILVVCVGERSSDIQKLFG